MDYDGRRGGLGCTRSWLHGGEVAGWGVAVRVRGDERGNESESTGRDGLRMEVAYRKEVFSIAYVSAVASVVGCNVASTIIDEDSIDMTLSMILKVGKFHSPKLDLQLKCTSKHVLNNNVISFDLKEKNFDELSYPNYLVPRILVVTLVPENPNEWVEQDQERLLMKKCSYWYSLKGMLKPSSPPYRVQIPDTQVFSPKTLLSMMKNISMGMTI